MRADIGAVNLPISGMRISPGGHVVLRMKCQPGPSTVLVTLATAPADYGKRQAYRILADGGEIVRLTELDPGGGFTRTMALDVHPRAPSIRLRLETDKVSVAPVILSAVRVFDRVIDASDIAGAGLSHPGGKMALALLTSKGSGYDIDAPEMVRLYHLLPQSPYLIGQTAVLYNFATRSAGDTTAWFRRSAEMARHTRVPLRVAFQMHWAGIPVGVPDGAGGVFTDLPYQQITYDDANRTAAPGLEAMMGERYDKRFGLTIPNRWSNTPWLTLNHPRLNQFRRSRLRRAIGAWRLERERLEPLGLTRLFPQELSTGEETVYWAKGVDDSGYAEANGGRLRGNLMGDFNPYTVAEALADGVFLDPRDGLDRRERWWLHTNLARWQQTIVDWMHEALPSEAIRLAQTGPVFASDSTRRNIFTEPYSMPVYPMKDLSRRHPGIEIGYVRDGRPGGEYWSGTEMTPWLVKQRERGRTALPNLECTGANDDQLVACLLSAYATGCRYATLYNWHHRPNTPQILRRFADRVADSDSPSATTAAVPLVAEPVSGSWKRSIVAGPDAFGVNAIDLIRVDDDPFACSVRVFVRNVADGRSIAVTAQVDAQVGPEPSVHRIPLPVMYPMQPGQTYAVTVVPLGAPVPQFAAAIDGLIAISLTCDVRRERARSLVIQGWQDALDIIQSLNRADSRTGLTTHARSALREARRLHEQHRPDEAYRAAIRAEQIALPATYHVQLPGGLLAPYPVTVDCPDWHVRATITAIGRPRLNIRVVSGVTQTARVRWQGTSTPVRLSRDVPVELTIDAAK